MRLESSIKSKEFARSFSLRLKMSGILLLLLPVAAIAQSPANQGSSNRGPSSQNPAARVTPITSTGAGSTNVQSRTTAQPTQPTGQLVLNRNAPNSSSALSGALELGEPSPKPDTTPKARPISSNVLQQSLPAAASPGSNADYSTASPYQLRAISSNQSSSDATPLRVTPVSSAQKAEFAPSTDDLKLNAPKVSRIPLPGTAKNDQPEPRPVPEAPLRQFTASPAPSLPKQPPLAMAVPSLESATSPSSQPPSALPSMPSVPPLSMPELPSLPSLDIPQAVSVPTPLPRSSEAEVGLKSPAKSLPKIPANVVDSYPSLPEPGNSLPPLSSAPSVSNNAALPELPRGTPVNRSNSSAGKQAGSPIGAQSGGQNGMERLRMLTPRIQVTLNGPQELSVGTPQSYSVVVRNDDRINLGGLILRLDIPPGVVAQAQPATHGKGEVERAQDGTTMLTWTFENLDAGAEANLPLRVIAETPKNFAVAMEWTLLPIAGSAGVEVLAPQLELALEGPNEVNFSEPNVYRLHIRNRGTADASDVAVKLAAEHFGSSATQIGSIGAGEQQTVDVELVFNEPGNIIIAAEASAAGNVAAASQVGVLVRQAVLEASMDAPERAYHSTEVPYVLTVRNAGDAVARNARAIITLPADCTPSSLPAQATVQNGTIVWDISQIRPGQLSEMPFSLSFAREGDNQISVQCTSSSGTPVDCIAITNVKAVTDLKLFVTDPVAPAPVSGEVEYELKLVNRGSKAAEQVSVVAMFSKDIEPIRAEGHRSQIATGQVRFQPITRIEPGQSITLKVFAQAATAGMHRFRAEVRTSEADVKLVQEQSTEYMQSVRRTASSPSNLIR